jgi:GrpB-like predicted nucleotidyltransferase (UPF0157 family)
LGHKSLVPGFCLPHRRSRFRRIFAPNSLQNAHNTLSLPQLSGNRTRRKRLRDANKKKKMLIQQYQERWVNDFNNIKKAIQEALSGIAIDIEHIGSTAIANLAAKPIIDIDIVYKKDNDFIYLKNELEKLGYHHNGNQGIKDREVFKRRESSEKHAVLDFIPHHLYVCPAQSEELQRHLAFRNYLNTHERERKEYERIKYKIAEEANQDKKAYATLKENKAKAFIESILKKSMSLTASAQPYCRGDFKSPRQ